MFAQAADVDIRSLITSIEEEKQHIAELQLELERHNAVLTEISKRLEAITNATTPEAAAAPVAVPEKSVSPRFDVYDSATPLCVSSRYCRFKLHDPIGEYSRAGHDMLLSTTTSVDVLVVPGVVASPNEFQRK